MSERGARQLPTLRSSFRRQLHDASLPPHYRTQLDDKRKQLDDSIHKYIAAKERDYKAYEKDLRQQHRAAQGQDGDTSRQRTSSDPALPDEADAYARANGAPSSSAAHHSRSNSSEAIDEVAEEQDNSLIDLATIAGLTDRRASLDRDRDFAGLFTPPYLSAIDDRDGRELEPLHSSSVPNEGTLESQGSIEHLRANSDSVTQARRKRPSHLALVQRTSSSGSSADGKLTSALKSPSQIPKQPTQKRVSLAVGDAIVAPSDSVPPAASSSNTPSHSRQRSSGSRRVLTTLSTETSQSSISPEGTPDSQTSVHTPIEVANADAIPRRTGPLSSNDLTTQDDVGASEKSEARPTPTSTNKLDPDGDLFDLEEVENVPIQHTAQDDFDSTLESDVENDEADMRVEADSIIDDIEVDDHRLRYDPREGLIPEPEDGMGNAVPYLEFQPGSSVASQQPIHPGFRRPSVSNDPVYRGKDYKDAERRAVEEEIYGSSFNRPASKGSFTAGSLGESYMAAHAAEMERMRAARKQTGVKT